MDMLNLGGLTVMKQSVIYALPAKRCLIFAPTGTITQANAEDMTGQVTITLDTNKQAEVAGGFVRCTTAEITVSCKGF